MNNQNIYETPVLTVISFEEDIVCTSGEVNAGNDEWQVNPSTGFWEK